MSATLFAPVVYCDERGEFIETWSERTLPGFNWLRDNISVSRAGVLRGIHGDGKTTKLVSCLVGEAYVVVVEPDMKSWGNFFLSQKNRLRLLVPPGHGLAYYAITDVVYSYKQDTNFGDFEQFTWKWSDPELAITWPCRNPILSERDR